MVISVVFAFFITTSGLGDYQTKQAGTHRTFVSPPLDGSSQSYKYTVRAKWVENGKDVDQSQEVYVKPGEKANVLFLAGGNVAAYKGK